MDRPLPKSKRQYVRNLRAGKLAAKLPRARGAPFPKFIEPCLATLQDRPPSGLRWVHEIKFDGYRLQLHVKEGSVRCYTRRGYDWTRRFQSLCIAAAGSLPCYSAVLDGEVVVQTEEGLSDFGALEDELAAGRSGRFAFFVFDLLYLDGFDLRRCALIDRKRVLEVLLKEQTGPIRYSEHTGLDGKDMYAKACQLELDGVVSKLVEAPYESGRSVRWIKATCRKRETFIVAGIAYKGRKFDGVYLARREHGSLLYAGKVEKGFSDAQKNDLESRARKLATKTQPLTKNIKKPKATWLKPALKVDVEYRALTGDGKLRHPSFKGVRKDF